MSPVFAALSLAPGAGGPMGSLIHERPRDVARGSSYPRNPGHGPIRPPVLPKAVLLWSGGAERVQVAHARPRDVLHVARHEHEIEDLGGRGHEGVDHRS